MVSAIYQFLNGMRACVRLDDKASSGWLAVEHGLQGCVLALLLFSTFFVVVIDVAYTSFKVDKDTIQWKVSELDGSHTGEVLLCWMLVEQVGHGHMSDEYKRPIY